MAWEMEFPTAQTISYEELSEGASSFDAPREQPDRRVFGQVGKRR